MAFFSKGTFLMKLRKLRTTSDARPLSRCMSSTISFICFMSGDRDSSKILAVSVLFRIAPSGWFISCAIPAAISPGGGEMIDVRELHHPLPRLHLRRPTAMPLEHQERDKTTLEQKHGAD